jgi:hypothetical protein
MICQLRRHAFATIEVASFVVAGNVAAGVVAQVERAYLGVAAVAVVVSAARGSTADIANAVASQTWGTLVGGTEAFASIKLTQRYVANDVAVAVAQTRRAAIR